MGIIGAMTMQHQENRPETEKTYLDIEDLDLDWSVPCEFKPNYHAKHGTGEASKRLTYGHDCGMVKVLLCCDGCVDIYKTITNVKCEHCGSHVDFLATTIIKIEDLQ